jgi:cation transport regulator ChaB
MRLPVFESEYADDLIPDPDGRPLEKDSLVALQASIPVSERLESSSQTLLVEAVRSFYFAKAFYAGWNRRKDEFPEDVRHALSQMPRDLMRLAVVSIGAVNDSSERTRSLHHTVLAMKKALADDPGTDAAAARDLIESIRSRIDANSAVPLTYVRHVRNKWAGHASFDRDFDDWADADSTLNIPLLEKGLEILVNAQSDLFEVIGLSETAARIAARVEMAEPSEGDSLVVPMTFDWSAVTVWAGVVRDAAKRDAALVIDQLAVPRTELAHGRIWRRQPSVPNAATPRSGPGTSHKGSS